MKHITISQPLSPLKGILLPSLLILGLSVLTSPGATSRSSSSRSTAGRSSASGAYGSRSSFGANTGRSGAYGTQNTGYHSPTTLGTATIQTDPETRSLVVIADEDTKKEIDRILVDLDKIKPQVLINCLFLEVTHEDDLDLGAEGWFKFNLGGNKNAAFGTAALPASSPLGGSGFLPIPNLPAQGMAMAAQATDWQMRVQALAQKNKVEVLSRPSILARNNQEAVIMVGQEVPFVTSSRYDNNGNQINTIQYSDVGIILRVTPFIASDNMVEMLVAPEISALSAKSIVLTGSSNSSTASPIIDKRSAETVVITPDGQSVVIGGLMEKTKTSSVSKVPVLGDIPLLGMAFRRSSTADSKKELLIFLTPHIVNTRDKAVALSEEEAKRATLAPDAFKDLDANKYFDTIKMTPPADGKKAVPDATKGVPLKKTEPAAPAEQEPPSQSTRKSK